jgi:putative DNA primase/helicase
VHLWLCWDELQSAVAARAALVSVLAAEGLKEGADGGVAARVVEIFPKAASCPVGGHSGGLVALPFARKSVALDGDMAPIETVPEISISAPVPVPEPEEVENSEDTEQADPALAARLRAALAPLPADDYQKWVDYGLALKSALGEAGFELWREWSKKSGKYPGDSEARRQWAKFEPDGRIGAGTILHDAEAAIGAPYLSDQWLALRFVEDHQHDLRFTALWGAWHLWNGAVWRRDDTLRTFSFAQEFCRRIAAEVNKRATAKKIAEAKTRAAVVALARENRVLATLPEQWNADPLLLGTPGGVVDLRTGEMRPARPDDLISKATRVAPGGDCPLWRAKLLEICGGDTEFVGFLQRWFGYCATGLTREEMLTFFVGDGGNGKGTVIETIAFVLGDYATAVPMTTLVHVKYAEHPTEIAKLHGVRMAVASETSDGARINASIVKRLTGGDKLTARFMRADYFDFAPSHKLMISGNAPLILGRVDKAIERRWLTVPFEQVFEPDKRLKEKLRKEAGGILSWLIDGCLQWQRVGLAVPEVVIKATEGYLRDQDDLAGFIEDRCIVEDEARENGRELYEAWKIWAERYGVWAGRFKEFRDRLATRFKETNSHNTRYYKGLRLRTWEEEQKDGAAAWRM